MDHGARHINYSDGLAHIQQEHIAAFSQSAGLDHELSRFWDRHEIASYIAVGQRNRPAFSYLLLKARHNRTTRTENIAKSDHREARSSLLSR